MELLEKAIAKVSDVVKTFHDEGQIARVSAEWNCCVMYALGLYDTMKRDGEPHLWFSILDAVCDGIAVIQLYLTEETVTKLHDISYKKITNRVVAFDEGRIVLLSLLV